MKDLKDLEAQYEKLGKEIEKLKAEPKPPFWGWFGLESPKLQRVIKIEDDQALVDQDNSDMRLEDINWCGSWSMMRFFIRLATPEEIKEHLVKLAKEKGFMCGKRVKSACHDFIETIKPGVYSYSSEDDSLYFANVCVYLQGKWAEIVPSLPSFEEIGLPYSKYSGYNMILPDKGSKVDVFVKLLTVAEYVNEGWELDSTQYDNGKQSLSYVIYYDFATKKLIVEAEHFDTASPVPFKSEEAGEQAIEIFRHNGAEQELINFFK